MSQVRKFLEGGTAPITLFDVAGRNVSKDDIVYLAKKNKNALIANGGISGDDATAVSSAYDDILNNIENGNIRSMDLSGGLFDNSGDLAEKSKNDPSYNIATTLLGLIISKTGTATTPENTNKKYIDTKGILDTFSKELYGGLYEGSKSDLKLWMNFDTQGEDGKYTRTGRMNKFADLIDIYLKDLADYNYEGSNYKDKAEHISKLTKARDLLRKGEYNDDVIRSLMGIGIPSANVDILFEDGSETSSEEASTENQTLSREEAIKTRVDELVKGGANKEQAQELAELEYDSLKSSAEKQIADQIEDLKFQNWLTPINESWKEGNFDVAGNTENYNWNYYSNGLSSGFYKIYDKLMGANHGNNTFIKYFSSQSPIVKRNLRAALHHDALNADSGDSKTMTKLSSGLYLLNNYVDYATNSAWVYDTTEGKVTLKKVKISDIQLLLSKQKEYWKNNIESHKEGGSLVLIASNGLSFEEITKRRLAKQHNAEQKEKLEEATKSGKTPEQAKHDTTPILEFNLLSSDGVRLGAALIDLTGAVAAFIPGGSLYSLGEGIVADFSRMGADISDGANTGTILKNLGLNLIGTAAGAIPIIGTEGKLAKAWKGISKFIPYLIQAAGMWHTGTKAYTSYQNIEAGKGTLEDYTNIINFVTTSTNGLKTVGNGMKASKIKLVANTGESKISIAGKNGKIELNKLQLTELQNSSSRGEMQLKLSKMPGHENDEIDFGHNVLGSSLKAQGKHFWNKGTSLTESPVYDFGRVTNNKYSKDVSLLLFKLPEFHFFDKLSFGYNPGKITTPIANQTATPIVKPSLSSETTARDWANADEIPLNKQGGRLNFVLKMAAGNYIAPVAYDDIFDAADWDYGTRYRNIFNNGVWSLEDRGDIYNTNGEKNGGYAGNNLYDLESGEESDVANRQTLLKLFYDQLSKNKELAEHWANRYKELNKNSNNSFMDGWWNKDGSFNFNNFKTSTLWSDNKNGIGHDVYKGKVYYIDGQKGFFGKNIPRGYIVDPNDEGKLDDSGLITKYKLIKDPNYTGSYGGNIDPAELDYGNTFTNKANLAQLGADALRVGDLVDANLSNLEMTDILKSQQSIFKVPDYKVGKTDLTSFSIILNGWRDAGKMMNVGRRLQNSTSSGRLGALYALSAASKANDIIHKANTEAQAYRQKYADENTDVVNYNIKSMIDNGNFNLASGLTKFNRDKELDAGKVSVDHTNRSSFVQEMISRLDQQANEFKAYQKQLQQPALQQKYKTLLARNTQYNNIKALADEATKNGDTVRAALLNNMLNQISNNIYNTYYNELYGQYGMNLPTYQIEDYTLPATRKAVNAKNGGTLEDNIQKARLKDNDRLEKGILTMIKENRKAIDNSSAITRAIINKVMSKF